MGHKRQQKPSYAGLRMWRYHPVPRGYVSIYDAREAGLDDFSGRWVTVCEKHSHVCNHETLERAKSFLMYPNNWCDKCSAIVNRAERLGVAVPAAPVRRKSRPRARLTR